MSERGKWMLAINLKCKRCGQSLRVGRYETSIPFNILEKASAATKTEHLINCHGERGKTE